MSIEGKSKLIIEIKNEIQNMPTLISMSNEDLEATIEQQYARKLDKIQREDTKLFTYLDSLTFKEKAQIQKSVYDSIRGLDILGHIISDKTVTEIMINGYDHIFVERAGHVVEIEDKFESQERLTDVITKFVQDAGRAVNESNPIVDTRLSDGSRVNVVLQPIAINGPIVTIRRFPETTMTIEKLLAYGSITQEVADFLQDLVIAKYNIFVSGGTGSGKTTFLNALSNFIPKHERVITIEDSAELQIKGVPNLVRLETRNSNSAGAGGITIRDLIKSSLRMRPERIVVGEVRGSEALDMLQAMNTGHDGSLSTGHANSAQGMLSRLETMVLGGAEGLPLEAIRQQIATAVDVIVHLSRLRDFSRKTVEITELAGYENGQIILNKLYEFVETEDSTNEKVRGSLVRTEHKMQNTQKLRNAGIYNYF